MTTQTSTAHHCHARDCEKPVPPRMFMCRRHWFIVPKAMQAAIWATYRPGQERAKDPSPEYLEAATEAVNYVAEFERRKAMTAQTSASAAYPARQTFGRTAVVHAVASQRINLPRLTLGHGEPLCGTYAELQPCPPGLFVEPISCTRCQAVIAATDVTIGDPS